MIKRSFYKLLAIGNGRQLFLLLVATLVVIAIGVFLGEFVFKGGLDIILVVFGFLLVSTFFACIFANIFKNVAQSVRSGDSRYNFSGHVLILGAGHQLKSLLLALKGDDREVVVVSSKHVGFKNDCIYYKGSYEDEQVLATVGALSASAIYVIGEDDPEHDSKSLHCLEVLRKICKSPDHDIHCYLSLRDQTTFEVFCYLKLKLEESRFMVDIFSEYEFMAEELLVESDFLPVIKAKEDKRSRVVLLGTGAVAQAVAYTAAHISHYPNFATGAKTCITFVDENCRRWMDRLLAARPGLFKLSRYTFVDKDGSRMIHEPEGEEGDFLDVEWEFVDSYCESTLVKNMLESAVLDETQVLSICVCYEVASKAIATTLHLPRMVFGNANIAIYWPDHCTDIIDRVNESGMYGKVRILGGFDCARKYANSMRVERGKRANFIYEKFLNPYSNLAPQSIWYKLSEAHKNYSIYCANGMPLRLKCFDPNDKDMLFEAEHRRRMMSMLLMGYSAGKTDKKTFTHQDVTRYELLSDDKKKRDESFALNADYIVNGDPEENAKAAKNAKTEAEKKSKRSPEKKPTKKLKK